MNQAFLIQTAASFAAVGAMVALAAWAKIGRPAPPLDDARVHALLGEDFPGRALDHVWIAADGAGAMAKSGALALVLCRHGDGYVARQIPWAQALAASFKNGQVCIDLGDIAAPRAVIALTAWPPTDLPVAERAA